MFLVCGVSFVALALLFLESAAVTKCRSSRNFVRCGRGLVCGSDCADFCDFCRPQCLAPKQTGGTKEHGC